MKFINTGSTLGAVNFPEMDIRYLCYIYSRAPSADSMTIRVINVHQNVPGVLKQITKIVSDYNIEKQMNDGKGAIAYFMADVTVESEDDMKRINNELESIPENILTRILF